MGKAKLTLYPARVKHRIRSETLKSRQDIAEKIAEEARQAAPVKRGDYRRGISVNVRGTRVEVVNTDNAAIHKEYGTSKTPAHAVMTRAASKYGRYVGMKPRGR